MFQLKAGFSVYAALVFAEVIYGVWPLIARVAINEGFDPIVFALYRCGGAAVLLLTVSLVFEDPLSLIATGSFRQAVAKESKEGIAGVLTAGAGELAEAAGAAIGAGQCPGGSNVTVHYVRFFYNLPWPLFGVMGALICMNSVGHTVGVALTSPAQAALMQPVIPVVACLTSLAAGTETLHAGKFAGVLISVAGAMYVVYVGQSEAESKGVNAGRLYQLGTMALFLNVFCTAFYFVLQKLALRALPPVFLCGMAMMVGAGYLAVLVPCYNHEFHHGAWWTWALTPTREAALAYGIILTTVLNFIILAKANEATNPSTVVIFSTLQPLIASGLGIAWWGVYPEHRTLVGGAAIIVGLLVAVTAQTLRDRSAAAAANAGEALCLMNRNKSGSQPSYAQAG